LATEGLDEYFFLHGMLVNEMRGADALTSGSPVYRKLKIHPERVRVRRLPVPLGISNFYSLTFDTVGYIVNS
jgi:hypothetical protein